MALEQTCDSSSRGNLDTLGNFAISGCVCLCVYLPRNLSKYIYVCGNVGAKKAEAGGGDTFFKPRFLPLGLGLSSMSWGITTHPVGFTTGKWAVPGSSAKANVLEIVLYNDICHRVKNKLDVTGVGGTGEVGVDFLGFLVAV